ncbi:MAG: hypothetical protein P8M07_08255 [Flavobacteriales bacterium]|nr:hypothetical protein [Flavobacteriales bacterium]
MKRRSRQTRHLSASLVFLGALWAHCGAVWAQDLNGGGEVSQGEVVQVSGVVITGDSLSPVSFATVYRTRDQRGTITNGMGFFSMPARVGDTLRFTSVGLISTQWVVAATEDQDFDDRLSVVQTMSRDTVLIGEATVHPWPARDKFRHEFMALQLGPDAIERGRRNLDPEAIFDRMSQVGTSPQENYLHAMNQQAQLTSYQGGYMPVSLLSPLAWAKFLSALRNGDFERE